MSPEATWIDHAEDAATRDLEEIIALSTAFPELAAERLPRWADLADRFCDFVGAMEERHAGD